MTPDLELISTLQAENAKLRAEIDALGLKMLEEISAKTVARADLKVAQLQVDEARDIVLDLHKNPNSHEAHEKAIKFLSICLCEEKVDRARYGRETCSHVLPCPMHKRKDEAAHVHRFESIGRGENACRCGELG
jgi:hypothetical protein